MCFSAINYGSRLEWPRLRKEMSKISIFVVRSPNEADEQIKNSVNKSGQSGTLKALSKPFFVCF